MLNFIHNRGTSGQTSRGASSKSKAGCRHDCALGAFYRTAMLGLGQYLDRKLVRWAQRKYKTLRRHNRRSEEWLHKMKKAYPRQFVHWQFQWAQVG